MSCMHSRCELTLVKLLGGLLSLTPKNSGLPVLYRARFCSLQKRNTGECDQPEGLGIYRVRAREFIANDPEIVFNAPSPINGRTIDGKWTRALLEPRTRSILDGLVELEAVHRFDDIAQVDVGIVTGANKFFLVGDQTVQKFGLEQWTHPMFGRSGHCPGVIYDESQHRSNAAKGLPTNFLWFKDGDVEENPGAKAYIRNGETLNLHTRYKCRIRKPWYLVPSVYATEVGMLKRSHDTPRLILNTLRAYTTDTAYRVRVEKGPAEQLVFSFVNALTALSAELEGRHYGGGVLELVPSEIERLLIPLPKRLRADVISLDDAVRALPMDVVNRTPEPESSRCHRSQQGGPRRTDPRVEETSRQTASSAVQNRLIYFDNI